MRHTRRAPTTLTDAETTALLQATARADSDFRDHLLISIALGTGLRVSELVALNVGDVRNGKGAKGVWVLRPETTKGNVGGTVPLPDRLRRKVSRYIRWKVEHGEPIDDAAPLLVSRGGGRGGRPSGGRTAVRTAQHTFKVWQERCGFDRRLNFHVLRHTCATNLWRLTGDIRLVQQVMRHANITTTAIYAHASIEDCLDAVQQLPC